MIYNLSYFIRKGSSLVKDYFNIVYKLKKKKNSIKDTINFYNNGC